MVTLGAGAENAVDEGALDELRTGDRPRSVIWVAGRGAADSAGAMVAATVGGAASEPIALTAEVLQLALHSRA